MAFMLRFGKALPYLPDPQRLPAAAPGSPDLVPGWQIWDSGEPFGWTLFYGYLTTIAVTADDAGGLIVENAAELVRETGQPRVLDQFAPGHFGLACGYILRTPSGLRSLILPAANPHPGLQIVTGLVETDWYPRQLFLVFQMPERGRRITLARGDELARVVLVAQGDGTAAEPANGEVGQKS